MKDKITVAIACAFLIGMFFISRTASIASSNESFISEKILSSPAEDTTMDFIDYETPETTPFDEAGLQTEISAMNTCTLESTDTDALTFGEAFGYYRQCLGPDSSFQWKGIEYTTLISEEVIIQLADSVKVDDIYEETEVSQIR
tara:strand:+ start:547 stop:978 length:432 start_codon:yes stop_codon:yes gene_type:complete